MSLLKNGGFSIARLVYQRVTITKQSHTVAYISKRSIFYLSRAGIFSSVEGVKIGGSIRIRPGNPWWFDGDESHRTNKVYQKKKPRNQMVLLQMFGFFLENHPKQTGPKVSWTKAQTIVTRKRSWTSAGEATFSTWYRWCFRNPASFPPWKRCLKRL